MTATIPTMAADCDDDGCRILISPLPVPLPCELVISSRAAERSVTLVDSRKPNSRRIIDAVADQLRRANVRIHGPFEKRLGAKPEDERRYGEFQIDRGVILLGVFD